MFFDDRLATVLRHRADGEAAARTQYRQLLDLLGHDSVLLEPNRDDSLVAAAWLRLGALSEIIPVKQRASIIRAAGWRLHNPELVAHLAENEPDVASAAISRAELTEDNWLALIPHLPIRARGFLRLQTGLPENAEALLEQLGVHDRGLPMPEAGYVETDKSETAVSLKDTNATKNPSAPTKTAVVEKAPSPPSSNDVEKSEIAELVKRIAEFQKDRDPASAPTESSPRLPLDEPAGVRTSSRNKAPTHFSFAADTAGRIEWAEHNVAPMVIGKRLIAPRQLGISRNQQESSLDSAEHAFTRHQPISGALLTLEGAPAIAGDWVVDAQPRFASQGGRFHGYVGRMRRPVSPSSSSAKSEADRVRQLLHELRTPVNATQGFAELIQQQLFGPVPNEYRALAANIASDSARILAGFDELERLARLESGALSLAEGTCDLASIISDMAAQLQTVLAPRLAGFILSDAAPETCEIAIAPDDAEAMIWRIMATLAGSCAASEKLQIRLEKTKSAVKVTLQLPSQLQAEANPFASEVKPSSGGLSAGLFGTGFSLRLARAEAQTMGGDVTIKDGSIVLSLPLSPDEA
ncbi:MAG: histidine kinase dimerization/phospho-acceptor domain-containing protein [Erythrobacter sp.]